TALCAVIISAAHTFMAARSIFGSGLPEFAQEPFFAPFVNSNHAGTFLAAALVLATSEAVRKPGLWRHFFGFSAFLLGLAVWSTGSRGALASSLCGLMCLAWLAKRRKARGAAIASATVVSLLFLFVQSPMPDQGDFFTGRLQWWSDGWALFRGVPWLGTGAGGFADGILVFKQSPDFSTATHAHNEMLQALCEFGVVGGLAWFTLLGSVWWFSARRCLAMESGPRRNCLAGILGAIVTISVSALVDFPLRVGSIASLFALLMGSGLGMVARDDEHLPAGPLRWASTGLFLVTLVGSSLLLVDRDVSPTHDPDPSLDEARAALLRRPLDARRLLVLGRAAAAAGETELAVAAVRASTLAHPTLPWAWVSLARLSRAQGDEETSRASYARLLDLDMNAELRDSYLEEALRTISDQPRALLEVLPDRVGVLVRAAEHLDALNHPELAETAYLRAMKLDSGQVSSYARRLV
ncbi:MAG: O-antigen ligase family protein, partial [Myxococcota bacterium]|nr:O-antigen ligase family protein [Myxococcota bacterium]